MLGKRRLLTLSTRVHVCKRTVSHQNRRTSCTNMQSLGKRLPILFKTAHGVARESFANQNRFLTWSLSKQSILKLPCLIQRWLKECDAPKLWQPRCAVKSQLGKIPRPHWLWSFIGVPSTKLVCLAFKKIRLHTKGSAKPAITSQNLSDDRESAFLARPRADRCDANSCLDLLAQMCCMISNPRDERRDNGLR